MKSPVLIVAVTLTVATLLAATFLIATGARGQSALSPADGKAAERILSPIAK